MSNQVSDHEFTQALAAIEEEQISDAEKVDMLTQIGMGLQQKPKSPQSLHNAITLYDRALEFCEDDDALTRARIEARKATALQSIPENGSEYLLKAQLTLEAALPILEQQGSDEEKAEAQMNLGLINHNLAGFHQAKITDAIALYQRALHVFTREKYATEFAILHNNLATAYLSMPMTDERGKMREALAVQSFEEALTVVTLIDQPSEYAMLQNNLGNALQYVSSSHAVENNYRALDAYDEALKVRTKSDTPMEYANTVCNKANCLRNLPDDLENPDAGNNNHLMQARDMYREARDIFIQYGDTARAGIVEETLSEVEQDLGTGHAGSRDGKGFGESRI
tara:strand:- start:146 stop:1162 length:1017 start_codon:yes stop_codon:yes gene_type:complete